MVHVNFPMKKINYGEMREEQAISAEEGEIALKSPGSKALPLRAGQV